jgi:hypothetical protein
MGLSNIHLLQFGNSFHNILQGRHIRGCFQCHDRILHFGKVCHESHCSNVLLLHMAHCEHHILCQSSLLDTHRENLFPAENIFLHFHMDYLGTSSQSAHIYFLSSQLDSDKYRSHLGQHSSHHLHMVSCHKVKHGSDS